MRENSNILVDVIHIESDTLTIFSKTWNCWRKCAKIQSSICIKLDIHEKIYQNSDLKFKFHTETETFPTYWSFDKNKETFRILKLKFRAVLKIRVIFTMPIKSIGELPRNADWMSVNWSFQWACPTTLRRPFEWEVPISESDQAFLEPEITINPMMILNKLTNNWLKLKSNKLLLKTYFVPYWFLGFDRFLIIWSLKDLLVIICWSLTDPRTILAWFLTDPWLIIHTIDPWTILTNIDWFHPFHLYQSSNPLKNVFNSQKS